MRKLVIFFAVLFLSLQLAKCKLDKDTPILIVGAGISGIAALSKLIENGYNNVTLLEASDRIGGRINTVLFGSSVIDLGAQWVHGEKGNVIWEMVEKENILDVTPDEYFEGWLINSESKKPTSYEELLEIAGKIYTDVDCDFECAISFGDFFEEEYYKEVYKDKNKHLLNDSVEFLNFYEKVTNIDEAANTWFETSTSVCTEFHDLPGEYIQNWKDNGFKTVFDFITKKRPDPSKDLKVEEKIKFNKEVTHIDWSKNSSVSVKTRDNSTFEAKHVIVTVSLGVLKANHKTMFTPPLPSINVNSIEGLPFGTLNKIVLEFEKPFWTDDWSGFSLIWTHEGLLKVKETKNEWTKGIIGFWRVSYQPNILCGWMVGEEARKMELLSIDDIREGVMYSFKEFLGDRIKYTTPKAILPSRWNSNPLFRGSYSSRSVLSDETGAWASELALPVNNTDGLPVILFAGEASHPHFYSGAHGALETGIREAERLMKLNSASRMEMFAIFALNLIVMLIHSILK